MTARTKVPSISPISCAHKPIALILNAQQIADRSSRMELRKNEDRSVDIYCAEKGVFDRSWQLPDFEAVN
jgi:hypothetical protein